MTQRAGRAGERDSCFVTQSWPCPGTKCSVHIHEILGLSLFTGLKRHSVGRVISSMPQVAPSVFPGTFARREGL